MILRAENIKKKYGSRTVVKGVSINVEQGEIVGLLGPNGAGKTTSFYMIVGLIRPNEGKIFLENQEITDLPMYKRAQLGIGYLPQEPRLDLSQTVAEAVDEEEADGSQSREFGVCREEQCKPRVLDGVERCQRKYSLRGHTPLQHETDESEIDEGDLRGPNEQHEHQGLRLIADERRDRETDGDREALVYIHGGAYNHPQRNEG